MIALKPIFNLLKLLNSETTAGAIAAAFAVGLVLGLVPASTPQFALVAVAVLFLRVNLSACMVATGLFKLVAIAASPALDRLGRTLLEAEGLRGLWTALANSDASIFMLHNSVTLGATLASAALFLPTFFLFRWAVGRYRDVVGERLAQSRIAMLIKSLKVYRLYRWGRS